MDSEYYFAKTRKGFRDPIYLPLVPFVLQSSVTSLLPAGMEGDENFHMIATSPIPVYRIIVDWPCQQHALLREALNPCISLFCKSRRGQFLTCGQHQLLTCIPKVHLGHSSASLGSSKRSTFVIFCFISVAAFDFFVFESGFSDKIQNRLLFFLLLLRPHRCY